MYRALRENKKGRDLVYTGKEIGGRVQERPSKPVNKGWITLICLISDTLTRQSSKEQGPSSAVHCIIGAAQSSAGPYIRILRTSQKVNVVVPIYQRENQVWEWWRYLPNVIICCLGSDLDRIEPNCNSKPLIYYLGGHLKRSYVSTRLKSTLTSSQSVCSPKHILNFSAPDSLLLLSVPPGKTCPSFYLSKSYCAEVTSFISFKLCLYFWCHHLPCVRIICVYLSTLS